MGGENENNEGMANFIVSAKTIENHFECVTIPIHHVGKTDTVTPRGWSGLHAANDVEIRLSGITGTRTGEVTKMKDGDGFGFSFQFELAQTEVGKDEEDGAPVTTCVVANLRALPKPDAAQAAQSKTSKRSQREFDAAFAEAIARRGEDYFVEGKTVRAVWVKDVRPHFAERWAVLEPDPRKKTKAISAAFNGVLKALPPSYHTRREGDIGERIWRD